MTRQEKIERYIDCVIDSMDYKTMYAAMYEYMTESLGYESDEYIDDLYNEYFEEQ